MGMYTEFHFNAKLKKDVPDKVLDILRYMMHEIEELPSITYDDPLFQTQRWWRMLNTDSYYFDADTHSTVRYDETSKQYYLCIRCNLKNYEDEIEKFIAWIKPYLNKVAGEFLGFMRFETDDTPTLIYM